MLSAGTRRSRLLDHQPGGRRRGADRLERRRLRGPPDERDDSGWAIPDLRVVHEALSLATLAALTAARAAAPRRQLHGPEPGRHHIPFVSGYQRFWTSMGIVAGWMLMLLGLSYYVRGRIGPARWRKLHRFTALAWVLGVVHAVGEGTDAGAALVPAHHRRGRPARRRAAGGPALRHSGRDAGRAMIAEREIADAFACFGGTCGAIVRGDGETRRPPTPSRSCAAGCSPGTTASRASSPAASCRR